MSQSNDKVLSLSALGRIREQLGPEPHQIVFAHGSFDLLHHGHIQRLTTARALGNVLVVGVARGSHHAGTPVLDQGLRVQTVAALPTVDFVVPFDGPSVEGCVRELRPDVLVQGVDPGSIGRASSERAERVAAIEVGARSVTLDESGVHRHDGSGPSPEAASFLHAFRQRYQEVDVIERLKALRPLKALVVGDAIVDEYHFCRPYGMPLKSPVIAAQFQHGEAHAGGVLAVANHLASFLDQVHLVTVLGARDTREQFVREHLRSNVLADLFVRPDAPTTVKRRYVRQFLIQKLFEISFFNDSPLPVAIEGEVNARLDAIIDGFDLVVVADYGHGFISPRMIDLLCGRAKFLAVNTQLNSVNYGYHVITRYPRADYMCIDHDELRMASRDRLTPIPELVPPLADRLSTRNFTVTMGHHGSFTYGVGREGVMVPVLAKEVVDTIGAGDAYLSLTAPGVCAGWPLELVGFVGNVAGALAVRIVGNRESVGPDAMFAMVGDLLR